MNIADIFGSVRLNLDTGEFEAQAAKAADKAGESMGQRMKKAVGGAVVGGAIGAAFSSTAVFAGFEKRMNEVFTLLPNLSRDAMDKMTADTKAFARETGRTTEEVIPALYQAISAGVPPENVFDFLRVANKGATAGVAKTADEVSLLTAVTKGFGDTSQEAVTKAADLAQLMVKLGQTTIPELAASYGKAVPLASALKISQEELAAASASLFGVTGNTAEVMTQQKAVFTALIAQNPLMTAALKKMGFATSLAAIESLGFKGTLDGLVKTTGGSTQQLQGMLGSAEAVTATLALTGAQSETFTANLDAMGDSAGTVDTAFKKMDDSAEAGARKFAAKLETMAIDLGTFVNKFGPLPLIIAQTFGPKLTTALATGIGTMTTTIAPIFGGMWTRIAGSSVVTKAVAWAGGKAATVYLTALIAGDRLAAALSGAWSKVAGSSVVMAAARMAGGTVAAAFAAAAAATIIAAPVAIAWYFTQKDASGRTAQVAAQQLVIDGMQAEGASVQALRDKWQELQVTAMQLWQASNGRDGLIADVFGTKAENEENLASVRAMLRDVEAQLARTLGEPVGRDLGQGWTSGVAQGVTAGAPAVQTAYRTVYLQGKPWRAAANARGQEASAALAQGILDARAKPVDAFDTLKDMIKHALTPMREIARLHGQLTSKALRDGLRSGDPAVRAQAQAVAKAAANRLGELAGKGGTAGRAAMRELDKGIRSKIPAVRAASQAAKDAAVEKLEAAKVTAGNAGQAAGEAFAKRLKAAVASGDFHVNASVGFTLPGHAAGGEILGPSWVGEKGPEIFVPPAPGRILSHEDSMAAVGGGSGNTITIYNPEPRPAEADIARVLRRVAALGMA